MNCLHRAKKYDLHSFTGTVTGLGKEHIIYTFGRRLQKDAVTGDKWLPAVQVNAASSAFNHIFLTDMIGKEHSIRLADFDIACREGHEITAIWAVKQDERNGPHIAVINQSTSQTFFAVETIRKMFRPCFSFYVLAAILLIISGYLSIGKKMGVLLVLLPGMSLVVMAVRWRSQLAAKELMTRLRNLIKK